MAKRAKGEKEEALFFLVFPVSPFRPLPFFPLIRDGLLSSKNPHLGLLPIAIDKGAVYE